MTYVVSVVHSHSHAGALEVIDVHNTRFAAILGGEDELKLARSRCNVVCRSILIQRSSSALIERKKNNEEETQTNLISECVSPNDDRLYPPGDRLRY